MTKELYSLTDAHRAQLKPHADFWIANALSTRQMDEAERESCRVSIPQLYQAADLPVPKNIVFVESPLTLAISGSFAAAIWWLSKNDWKLDGKKYSQDAVWGGVLSVTDEVSKLAACPVSSTAADILVATLLATQGAGITTTNPDGSPPKDVTAFLKLCCRNWSQNHQGGNQWSGWDSYLTFFRHVAKLDIDWTKYDPWEQLSLHSGPRYVHTDFCILSDRPETVLKDDQHRPHASDGPQSRWRDGWEIFYVHGAGPLKRHIVLEPDKITVADVDKEPNAEIRRIMLERFGQTLAEIKSLSEESSRQIGWGRYLDRSGAKEIQRDDYGILYERKEKENAERMLFVRVTNGTAEADGSFRQFILRVPVTAEVDKISWKEGAHRLSLAQGDVLMIPYDNVEKVERMSVEVETAKQAVGYTYCLHEDSYELSART